PHPLALLSSRLPRKQGSVLYFTTGIILQWLLGRFRSSGLQESFLFLLYSLFFLSLRYLSSISHLVLDEIHERSLQSDDLKVVLMSATLNTEKFSKYFNNCSMIHIPGYTYPVKEYLLEDVVELLRFKLQHQDRIPHYRRGFMHVQNVRPEKEQKEAEYCESWPCFARTLRDRQSFLINNLMVFYTGCTKSIPILNDSNHHLMPRCASTLKLGCVHTCMSPGKCYHLYNGLRASLLVNYQLPEIQRTPLEELCLTLLCGHSILKLGPIASFLRKTMDPPIRQNDRNALDRNEELTPLGFHLARMPVESHIGKMILFWAVWTLCLLLRKEKISDQRRKMLSQNSRSDHLTIVNAFWVSLKENGSRFEKEYCWENFLSANTLHKLHNMKGQFAEHLLAAGFNEKLIKAVIVAGLYPKVAKIRPNHSKKRPMPVKVYTKADGKVCIHPKSVNVEETQFHYTWLIYHLKMKTTSIFLYDCTEVSPFSLLFFGGDISIQRDHDQETIAVDEWIVFQSPARIAHLVKMSELDVLLEEKIKSPHPVVWNDWGSKDCAVLSAIIDLITTEETPAGGPRRGSQ
uniref:RNA helicase n=1 Tax=Sinocyclocheilus rhinocerous TaxID=307959 RepID=A0A673HNR8_9TELE